LASFNISESDSICESCAEMKGSNFLYVMFCSIVSLNYIKTKTPVEERSLLNISTHVCTSVTIPKHIPKAKDTMFYN